MKRILYAWCYVAFQTYMLLPGARTHQSRYGRFTLWLIGYGGAYMHSDNYADFRVNSFGRMRLFHK